MLANSSSSSTSTNSASTMSEPMDTPMLESEPQKTFSDEGKIIEECNTFLTSKPPANLIMVIIVSNDNVLFAVQKEIAECSNTLKNIIEDIPIDAEMSPIPLPNVSADALRKIFIYCKHEIDFPPPPKIVEEEVDSDSDDENKPKKDEKILIFSPFEKEYLEAMPKELPRKLFESVTLGSNYLDIIPLRDLCCKYIASWLKGKNVDEMRAILGVENDFTPEEEEQVRKDCEWISSRE